MATFNYSSGVDMKNLREIRWECDSDGETYTGFTDGSKWNGFDQIWCTLDSLTNLANDCNCPVADLGATLDNTNNLYFLDGWTTSIMD
jgi:hypothetical protein